MGRGVGCCSALCMAVAMAGVAFSEPAAAGPVVLRERLIVTRAPGALYLLELIELDNPGPERLTAVRWPVPQRARDVRLDGTPLRPRDGAFEIGPLEPGQRRTLGVSYRIDAERFPVEFRRPRWYPTESLAVLAAADTLYVEAPGIAAAGVQEIEGVRFRVYAAEHAGPDPDWAIRIQVASRTGVRELASWALTLLAILAATVAVARRGRRLVRRGSTAPEAQADAEALVQAIARLDLAYERVEIDERAYTALRRRLKERWHRLQRGRR